MTPLDIQKLSVSDLKKLAFALFDSIYVMECFSSRDCLLYARAVTELERRGYSVDEASALTITLPRV